MIAAGMRHIFRGNATALGAVLAGVLISAPAVAQQKPTTPQPANTQAAPPDGCSPDPVLTGCGTISFEDGSRLVGHFERGVADGPYKATFPDGNMLEGEFIKSRGIWKATYTRADGTIIDGQMHVAVPAPNQSHAFGGLLVNNRRTPPLIVVAYLVRADGSIAEPQVVYPNKGHSSYERDVVRRIMGLKFIPASIDRRPVESIGFYTVNTLH